MAQASESRHNLVGDVDHIVAFTDLFHALVIALGRHDHAAGTHDRLCEEGCNLLRSDLIDLVIELLDQMLQEVLFAHPLWPAIHIGRGDPVNQLFTQNVEADVIEGDARHGHGEIGRAVIAIMSGDDLLLLGFAQLIEIEVDHAHSRIVGHGAAGSELNVIEPIGRQIGDLGRQLGRRDRGMVAEGGVIDHLARLIGHGLCDLIPAIADIDAPEPTDSI